MPPIEKLKMLSDIYGISINEILSGEKLQEETYKEVAEENITYVLEKMETDEKQFENKMLFIMGITSVLVVAITFLLPKGAGLTNADRIRELVAVILVVVMAVISNGVNLLAIVLKKNK